MAVQMNASMRSDFMISDAALPQRMAELDSERFANVLSGMGASFGGTEIETMTGTKTETVIGTEIQAVTETEISAVTQTVTEPKSETEIFQKLSDDISDSDDFEKALGILEKELESRIEAVKSGKSEDGVYRSKSTGEELPTDAYELAKMVVKGKVSIKDIPDELMTRELMNAIIALMIQIRTSGDIEDKDEDDSEKMSEVEVFNPAIAAVTEQKRYRETSELMLSELYGIIEKHNERKSEKTQLFSDGIFEPVDDDETLASVATPEVKTEEDVFGQIIEKIAEEVDDAVQFEGVPVIQTQTAEKMPQNETQNAVSEISAESVREDVREVPRVEQTVQLDNVRAQLETEPRKAVEAAKTAETKPTGEFESVIETFTVKETDIPETAAAETIPQTQLEVEPRKAVEAANTVETKSADEAEDVIEPLTVKETDIPETVIAEVAITEAVITETAPQTRLETEPRKTVGVSKTVEAKPADEDVIEPFTVKETDIPETVITEAVITETVPQTRIETEPRKAVEVTKTVEAKPADEAESVIEPFTVKETDIPEAVMTEAVITETAPQTRIEPEPRKAFEVTKNAETKLADDVEDIIEPITVKETDIPEIVAAETKPQAAQPAQKAQTPQVQQNAQTPQVQQNAQTPQVQQNAQTSQMQQNAQTSQAPRANGWSDRSERVKNAIEELEMLKIAKLAKAKDGESEFKPAETTNPLMSGQPVVFTRSDGTEVEVKPLEVVDQAARLVEKAIEETKQQSEYSLVLNPEELGRITVKLTKAADGAVSVTIAAENAHTQRILEQHSELMQNDLRSNGINLESWQTVSESRQETLAQDYNGSSKNPYFRYDNDNNDDEEPNDRTFADIIAAM